MFVCIYVCQQSDLYLCIERFIRKKINGLIWSTTVRQACAENKRLKRHVTAGNAAGIKPVLTVVLLQWKKGTVER